MTDHPSKYYLSDAGIHNYGSTVPLRHLGTNVDGPLLLQMLKTAYSHGAYDEAKASLDRMSRAAFPSAYTDAEHRKGLDAVIDDMATLPDHDEDQAERTARSTVEALTRNPHPRIDVQGGDL